MMLSIWAVEGLPEIREGDDLTQIIGDGVAGTLEDGDILAVTSKIVSKAEGRFVKAADREDAITAESVRVVATRGKTRIVENKLGLVLAAAGVDSSNTPEGFVLLLPEDPDASARALASALRERFGVTVGVIVTDTLGRPWREGQADAAIGAAGIRVLDDLRGTTDANGRQLEATIGATADEIASAADLVKGKSGGLPVAVVRGLAHVVGDLDLPGARSIVRDPARDLFHTGSRESWEAGYAAGLAAASAEDRQL